MRRPALRQRAKHHTPGGAGCSVQHAPVRAGRPRPGARPAPFLGPRASHIFPSQGAPARQPAACHSATSNLQVSSAFVGFSCLLVTLCVPFFLLGRWVSSIPPGREVILLVLPWEVGLVAFRQTLLCSPVGLKRSLPQRILGGRWSALDHIDPHKCTRARLWRRYPSNLLTKRAQPGGVSV